MLKHPCDLQDGESGIIKKWDKDNSQYLNNTIKREKGYLLVNGTIIWSFCSIGTWKTQYPTLAIEIGDSISSIDETGKSWRDRPKLL